MIKSKIVKEVKVKPPKIRNGGTMTEAAFWSWIRSALRNRSRFWIPIGQAKNRVRRRYNGPNRRQKWEYQCAECKDWFMGDKVSVDHLVECGSLKCAEDLPGFIERLFCEADKLQVLCEDKCHSAKTLAMKIRNKEEKDGK